ncbi:MAG TPA: hypothetical protein VKU19_36550 [Bryobacteraceae bacterium]|nr:hypothetical protein [Bryobacteraceae bacterium]
MPEPNYHPEAPLPATPQPRYALLIQIASLLATGTLLWMNTISPKLHRYSWATLIGNALGYTLFACASSAAITGSLLFAIPRTDRRDVLWKTLRASAAGAWFAPAIILLSEFSPASLAASLVLVVVTTRLLYSEWLRVHTPEEPLPVWIPPDPMFGEADPPRPFFLKELAPSLTLALATQSAVTAFAMRARLLGSALFVLTAAMFTISLISRGLVASGRAQSLPRSVLSLALTILLAAGLTVGGLRGRIGMRGGSDPSGDPTATANGQPARPSPPPVSPPMAAGVDGTYPGVILQPEMQPVPRLVAPPPDVLYANGYVPSQERTIAFEGEYWMYRFLYRRPPPNSYFRKGTPAEVSFHTPDHWPLMMEAHQKLDQALDLRSCRRIDVRLWNADPFPGTVTLELLAIDSEGAGTHSQSFGKAPVRSQPSLGKEPVTAVPETVEFQIPSNPAPSECRELEVVFRRDQSRADKSSRIAIDRFVVVPR